jgi:uncharacterized membrane protein
MRCVLAFTLALVITLALAPSRPALARHSGGIHGGSHLFQEGVGSKSHHAKAKPPATSS